MNEDKIQFQKEQDDLLKFILSERFLKPWLDYKNDDFNKDYSLFSESKIELFLTSNCNQHCEYCYLIRHPELYPEEFNKKEIILKNLKILLDWIVAKDFYISLYEIFSGEIWHTDFGLEFFEIFYEYITKKGLRLNQILIASNASFLLDKKQTIKIQNWIDKFSMVGVTVTFSISVDGGIIENFSRPLNSSNIKTEEFYESMFMFAKHNKYYFHPMVSSTNVKYWIDNHNWWTEQCKKYDIDVDEVLMMLEVRNDDWTEESIKDYNLFIEYLIDTQIKRFNNDIKKFSYSLFGIVQGFQEGYVPYAPAAADTFPGCSMGDNLIIRLGDLAICPCHRTAYENLLYGKFIVEDNKIVDIKSNNVNFAIRVLMSNNTLCGFKCDTCLYNPYCLQGCMGSQYETMNDPLIPIPGVCKFFKSKWKNIINIFEKKGILDCLKNISPRNSEYLTILNFLKFADEVKKDVE